MIFTLGSTISSTVLKLWTTPYLILVDLSSFGIRHYNVKDIVDISIYFVIQVSGFFIVLEVQLWRNNEWNLERYKLLESLLLVSPVGQSAPSGLLGGSYYYVACLASCDEDRLADASRDWRNTYFWLKVWSGGTKHLQVEELPVLNWSYQWYHTTFSTLRFLIRYLHKQ